VCNCGKLRGIVRAEADAKKRECKVKIVNGPPRHRGVSKKVVWKLEHLSVEKLHRVRSALASETTQLDQDLESETLEVNNDGENEVHNVGWPFRQKISASAQPLSFSR
jgi:hypothetical protein